MARYEARTEEEMTAIVWDTVANRAVQEPEGGPIVWAYADRDAAEWFAGELNKLRTVEEIRAGI